ncbi:Predicted metal-dependent hydrolase, TIM-barrel fold [Parafrankia irregularis]|uniref:Predicted metal-dependent hydrolase, TIM-barrel fold n=1 Tax=Parafrankia irregularis TaxID=795642 RepID=A0A0S4QR66_9ACTN|nr:MULTISPECIES: amidohydrolase family protein [Parafrankia]MBE3202778.1 amidohydrolase [Parafrankia sp. CH37]CUU57971.1 Predicted metal-dependent hydrolase, TIM-barrel fold [Parafrankia irregularis]
MTDLRPIDADNHYYEPLDAFTRHLDPAFTQRGVQMLQKGRRVVMVLGGRVSQFIPNPTFNPVTKPGCLDLYFRGVMPEGVSRATLMELEPLAPEYRDRDARVSRLDEQGLAAAVLYPTLGVGVEEALREDVPATMASLHAFNRWLEDDWGYAYQNRLFAVPLISLADPDAAVTEVERVLALGARIVHVRPAPVPAPGMGAGGRSLGHPSHDPVWARLAEAGVPVAFHLGDSGYHRMSAMWGGSAKLEAFGRTNVLAKIVVGDRAIQDTMASLVVDGVFARHPKLRAVSIENGAAWVRPLLRLMKKYANQSPEGFSGDPVETFRRHVWVAPYYEDDIGDLIDLIGADHVLFGSDWPHAEGLAEPLQFEKEIEGLDTATRRRILRDNSAALLNL